MMRLVARPGTWPVGGARLFAHPDHAGSENRGDFALSLVRLKAGWIRWIEPLAAYGHEHLRLDDAHNDLRFAAGASSGGCGSARPATGYIRNLLTEW